MKTAVWGQGQCFSAPGRGPLYPCPLYLALCLTSIRPATVSSLLPTQLELGSTGSSSSLSPSGKLRGSWLDWRPLRGDTTAPPHPPRSPVEQGGDRASRRCWHPAIPPVLREGRGRYLEQRCHTVAWDELCSPVREEPGRPGETESHLGGPSVTAGDACWGQEFFK